MKNFKKLMVWQLGFELAIKTYLLTKDFPSGEKFNLVSQITKCGVSIPSNIAEGSSRSGIKDYIKFLEIALGSGYELETQLLVAQKLGYGNASLILDMLYEVNSVQKMLLSFIKTLRRQDPD
jgi:four helix bundle protein